MNRIRISARRMAERAAWLTLGVMMIVLAACSDKSSGDARDLLSTVPADAGAVVMVNVQSLMEKGGFKFKDGKPVPSAEATRWLDSLGDAETGQALHCLATGDLGMAYEAAVIFMTDQPYVSVLLDDPDKMRAGIDSIFHTPMTQQDGVWIGNRCAIKGNQLWMTMQYEARPEVINGFAELAEKKSILSKKVSESLVELKKDFNGVGDLTSLISFARNRRIMDMSEIGMINMALSALFENPSYLIISGDYSKEKLLTVNVGVLDDDYNPAKYLLPVGKVDTKAVKEIAAAADIVVALAVPSKLIDRVQKMASSFGGALPPNMAEILRPIDGTIVGATDPGKDAFAITIATTGRETSSLQNLLATFGSVVRDDKTIRLTSGIMEGGSITSDRCAELLKGSAGGLVMGPLHKGADPTVILFRPVSGSLEMEIRVNPGDAESLIPDAL